MRIKFVGFVHAFIRIALRDFTYSKDMGCVSETQLVLATNLNSIIYRFKPVPATHDNSRFYSVLLAV